MKDNGFFNSLTFLLPLGNVLSAFVLVSFLTFNLVDQGVLNNRQLDEYFVILQNIFILSMAITVPSFLALMPQVAFIMYKLENNVKLFV